MFDDLLAARIRCGLGPPPRTASPARLRAMVGVMSRAAREDGEWRAELNNAVAWMDPPDLIVLRGLVGDACMGGWRDES